jgi:hypothetical protein
MMIKLLYIIGFLALISAGALFLPFGIILLQGEPQEKNNPEISVIEKFQTLQSSSKNNNQIFISPLVKQARLYALYLNPPEPPTPKIISQPQKPVHRPLVTTPKFRLLSTSYYRCNPEKSLALVSEPGKGDHWIAKGERVGNFIVERVEKGSIVYRVGNQSHEMKIAINQSVQIPQIKSNVSASTRTTKPNLRLLSASQYRDVE